MKRVIKNTKHTEKFSRDKLHASIKASCMSARDFIGAAELTANKVCDHVEAWLAEKEEVTSSDIRRIAASAFYNYHPAAAYIYININEVN